VFPNSSSEINKNNNNNNNNNNNEKILNINVDNEKTNENNGNGKKIEIEKNIINNIKPNLNAEVISSIIDLEPDIFLTTNIELSNKLLAVTKIIFDYTKENEMAKNVGGPLPSLYIQDLTHDQIWEEIQLQNIPILRFVGRNIRAFEKYNDIEIQHDINKNISIDTDNKSEENSDIDLNKKIVEEQLNINDNSEHSSIEVENEDEFMQDSIDDEEDAMPIDWSKEKEIFFDENEMNEFINSGREPNEERNEDEEDEKEEEEEEGEDEDRYDTSNLKYEDFFDPPKDKSIFT